MVFLSPPLGRSVQQFPRAKRTGISLKELIHLSTLTHCLPLSSQPPLSVAFPNPFGRRLPGHAAFTALKVLLNRPTTDKASLLFAFAYRLAYSQTIQRPCQFS